MAFTMVLLQFWLEFAVVMWTLIIFFANSFDLSSTNLILTSPTKNISGAEGCDHQWHDNPVSHTGTTWNSWSHPLRDSLFPLKKIHLFGVLSSRLKQFFTTMLNSWIFLKHRETSTHLNENDLCLLLPTLDYHTIIPYHHGQYSDRWS